LVVCRKEEPRQLQAQYLDTIIDHRTTQVISRYENLVDSIDTFQELRGRDLWRKRKVEKNTNISRDSSGLRDPQVPKESWTQTVQSRPQSNPVLREQSRVDGARQSGP
jgi:hypothetical protein